MLYNVVELIDEEVIIRGNSIFVAFDEEIVKLKPISCENNFLYCYKDVFDSVLQDICEYRKINNEKCKKMFKEGKIDKAVFRVVQRRHSNFINANRQTQRDPNRTILPTVFIYSDVNGTWVKGVPSVRANNQFRHVYKRDSKIYPSMIMVIRK